MDVSKHVAKAEEALRKKNFDFAASFLQQVLSLQPDHGEARRLWCKTLRQRGERKPTPVWLAKVIGLPHLLSSGLCKLTRSSKGRARALERYFKLEPANPSVSLALGEALAASGFSNSAVAVYESLGEAAPKMSEPWKYAASCYAQLGKVDEALECLEKSLAADPRDAEAERMRKNLSADLTLRRGQYDQAGSSRDLMRDQKQVQKVEKSSRIHRSEDELVEEADELVAKVEANPADGRSRRRLAEIHSRKGEFEAAVKVLEAGLGKDENASELEDLIGDARLGALGREIAKLEKRFEEQKSEGVRADLEMLQEEHRDLQIAEFQRRVTARPTDLGLWYSLGKALQGADRLDDAIGAYQKAVKDPKTRVEALTRLGSCFFKKGLFDLAEKQLLAALEDTPDSSDRGKSILYNLGMIADKAGRSEDAFAHFSKIYEVDINYRDVSERIETLRN